MKKIFVLFLIIFLSLPAIGQAKKMRTRLYCDLSNYEIEDYLSRNDIIIVPVGPIEVNGGNPVDCEYVGPLAYAMKIAEKVDGLVLEHMTFVYPGGTSVGKSTLYFDPSETTQQLKLIARSLLRQGFKTQIYITGHGPSTSFMEPFVFEFLQETKVPILSMTMRSIISQLTLETKPDMRASMYGAYSIVGRLNAIPLSFEGISQPGLANYVASQPPTKMLQAANTGSYGTAWYYNSPYDHGGVPKDISAEEVDRLAKLGVIYINEVVDKMNAPALVNALRVHQKYIQDMVKKYGDLLPN